MIVALAIMTHIASGNVAAALDEARAAGDPFESTQAMTLGGAHTWGGDFDQARGLLRRATEMAPGEGNTFVEAVTPIFSAIGHLESGDTEAARRDATTSLTVASVNGFDDLAQLALAHSILARTTDEPEEAIVSAERGVDLARRSPEYVMFAYALASAGDVLCHHNEARGTLLLGEARTIIDRCPDPGIAGRYLARVEARHRYAAPPAPTTDLLDELTDRETGRAPLPAGTDVATRDRLRTVRVAQHRQDPLQGDLPQTRRRRPQSSGPSRPGHQPALTRSVQDAGGPERSLKVRVGKSGHWPRGAVPRWFTSR